MIASRSEKFSYEGFQFSLGEMKAMDQILLDQMPDPGFLLIKPNIILTNYKLIRLFRFNSKQDLLKCVRNGFQLFEDRVKTKVLKDIHLLLNFETIKTRRYQFIRKDKTFFQGKIIFKKLYTPGSKKPYGYFGSIYNTKHESIILKGTQKAFYKVFNDSSDTIFINDFNGRILKANKKFNQINFFAERSIRDYNLFQMIDNKSHKKLRERIEQLRNGNPTFPEEYRLTNTGGGSIYIEMNSQPIHYHNKRAFITRIRNISHQKEMEKKLFEAIIQTEEKEKQRFAQDLHDELGPFLSGIKLYIDEIELSEQDKNHRQELVEYLRKTVDEAIINTRIISNSLMSNILMDFGLEKALTSFVEKINNIQKVKIKLKLNNLNKGLNKILEINIYRIFIELINNSLKHSNADTIHIRLNVENSFIEGTYKDDGNGFNADKELKSPSGIGLLSIINRLKSNNATYTIFSEKNKGMQFEFRFPLN